MSRHCGPALAFDKRWFRRHQSALLWLLNAPLVRVWFRWVLRIRSCDCPPATPICEIGPHYFVVPTGRTDEYRADFRTHPKYAKRLYWAFRPLWWAMHAWDLLADCRWPQLSFGFQSLTAYPDAGSPGTTSCDGYVLRTGVDESFSTIRAGAGNGAYQTSDTLMASYLAASTTTNQFQGLDRSIMLFDTAALTASASISAATLYLCCQSKNNGLGDDNLYAVSSSPASNTLLAIGDYANLGSTSFGYQLYGSYGIDMYTGINLNSSGIANISLTSVSKFGHRGGWDRSGSFGGSWSSGAATYIICYSADYTGTSYDPKLTITYVLAKALTVVQYSSRNMVRALGVTKSVSQSSVINLAAAATRLLTMSVEQATTATLSSLNAIVLTVATTSVAVIATGLEKVLAVVQSSTAVLNRGLSWALSVVQSSTATNSMARFYEYILSVATTTVSTLQTGLFYPVELFVWQESVAVVETLRGRVLEVVQTSTATFQRSVGKILTVAQSAIARVVGLSAAGNIGMLPRLPAKILRTMNWLKRS